MNRVTMKGLLANVPIAKVRDFEADFLETMELKHRDALDELKNGVLSEAAENAIKETVKEVSAKYEN